MPEKRSKNFEKVKRYYDNGLWKIKRVRDAVPRWITQEEFELITGEAYVEEWLGEKSKWNLILRPGLLMLGTHSPVVIQPSI